jgi:dolichol-phosphate mannosyltransferase
MDQKLDQRTWLTADAQPPAAHSGHTPEIVVILPTFNERENLPVLIARIAHVLEGQDWEILVVDDNSPDGSAAVASDLAARDRRIRCIRRVGRRGLAGACIEGMLASQAQFAAVMDADLQHDEALLTAMLAKMRSGDVDVVVASRYCGTQQPRLATARARASRWSTALTRFLLKVELTDPLSGFFMIRRELIEEMAPSLSAQGFKILIDIAATGHGRLRFAELPYAFGARQYGESKLDARVALEFCQLLLAKLTNDAVSFRFLLFCLVGLSGVGVNMMTLAASYALAPARFSLDQTIATIFAIAWNFGLNNAFTYRDRQLVGWSFVKGLLEFELICAVGAISNVGIASLIYGNGETWWIAGLGGAVMGAVWNYALSAAFVWRVR